MLLQFIKQLVNQTCVQRYGLSLEQWQLSLIWSFTMSIFCIGGLLGSLAAGPLASKFGRLVYVNIKVPSSVDLLMCHHERRTQLNVQLWPRALRLCCSLPQKAMLFVKQFCGDIWSCVDALE